MDWAGLPLQIITAGSHVQSRPSKPGITMTTCLQVMALQRSRSLWAAHRRKGAYLVMLPGCRLEKLAAANLPASASDELLPVCASGCRCALPAAAKLDTSCPCPPSTGCCATVRRTSDCWSPDSWLERRSPGSEALRGWRRQSSVRLVVLPAFFFEPRCRCGAAFTNNKYDSTPAVAPAASAATANSSTERAVSRALRSCVCSGDCEPGAAAVACAL